MTSLIFGVICLYFAVTILRLPEERFRSELDQLTRREHGPRYYRAMRLLIWLVGFTGAAILLLRFF